jgi:hypothetical protein
MAIKGVMVESTRGRQALFTYCVVLTVCRHL